MYRKCSKHSDIQNCCNYPKIWIMRSYHRGMRLKDADGMANSEGLHCQTCHDHYWTVLFWWYQMSHLMRLWHVSNSVNSFFKRRCAGSPEPSLVAYVISTIISCAGSDTDSETWIRETTLKTFCAFCSKVKLSFAVDLSRLMTKPRMWLCAQRRLRSAWASAQSDQSLRCALSG